MRSSKFKDKFKNIIFEEIDKELKETVPKGQTEATAETSAKLEETAQNAEKARRRKHSARG